MTSQSIGQRIRRLREFRNLTQEELSARANVAVATVRKLEQGQRQSAQLSTLRALASALDTELERLVGQPAVMRQQSESGGLLALRDAIQDVSDLTGVLPEEGVAEPRTATAWMLSVREAVTAYWQGRYGDLTDDLPLLIREGKAVAREVTGRSAEEVWGQLALVYQLAASLATQAGHTDWAFEAVTHQLSAAQRASDPLIEGMGVSTLSWVLLRQGRWDQAHAVAERKAAALEPSFRKGTKRQFAVYGNLLLAAATPLARLNRSDEADELLNVAEAAATRSGAVRAYGTAFGVHDVRTQMVNVALAGSTSRPREALTRASRVSPKAISRPVHAASHRLDVAQAQYQVGDLEGALETLLSVEKAQPEWIAHQVHAAVTVREMLERERRRNGRLRALAARLGVDPTL
ncbi:helix-turn-helix transcriptional regulator [Streptomyces sp. 71268]|uniref:helix-turn-helix domain-containing protein n=1 Tax=Streptomyces sp. 71268 TaxID=3002640 RepID=UPI0023F75ED9|nr:helix-turn-helix transcriptional regulator [Streptomyces sp. 71268]WEV26212.1 helix-turn-helix transcriptional regulator [Streptomyces sp. 71268]